MAHASSLLSILVLAATFDSQLEIQATGEDEEAAIRAAEVFFQSDDEDSVQQLTAGSPPPSPSSHST